MKYFFSLLLVSFIGLNIANCQDGYVTDANVFYRSSTELQDEYKKNKCILDVYHPTDISDFPTIVWFFGGGLTGGNKYIPEEFKGKGIGVIAVNYRLSPAVSNPVYTEDAAAAVAWTFNNIERYGGSKDKIYVAGHSSGAYLAAMIALDKHYLSDLGIDANDIRGVYPLSAQCVTHETVRRERGLSTKRPIIDEFAPSYHVRADASPMTLITGGKYLDNPARYEENVYMHRMLEVVGHQEVKLIQLQGFDHGGMVDPACQIVVKDILKQNK